jgi:amino acid transporter
LTSTNAAESDVQELARFGYSQQLNRTLGSFSSFALSFSVICITSGLFADYGRGLRVGGPAFVWTWLIVGIGQFLVALVFAQLARQIPLSGYAYQWTRELAGPWMGCCAGWMMIIQIVTGMAGVAYALASYLVPFFGITNTSRHIVVATIATLLLAGLINHFGIKLASLVNDVSVIAEMLGSVLIAVLLLVVALIRKVHTIGYLFTHPQQPGGTAYLAAFLAASLMSVWTIGGFEAAANVAEETQMPRKRIPTAILAAEGSAVLLGFIMLVGFTLAIPSLERVVEHPTPALYIIASYFPSYVVNAALLLVSIAIFACVLANLTTVTRLVWAMARDGRLPASKFLSRVSKHKVPGNAIWVAIAITSVFTWWAQIEVVIMVICTFAMYVTYGIVVGVALWGSSGLDHPSSGSSKRIVSRSVCVTALVWIGSIITLLIYMSAQQFSRRAVVAVAFVLLLSCILGLGYRFLVSHDSLAVTTRN